MWAALAKPLVNVDFGRDRYTADVDEMQVCSSDLGLSCDICGNTAHELYTFRCYKKRPPGADVTGEDHRRLHRCKAFLGKDCGKGLLGKRSEHSKALEGLEKVLMQPDADEQLQVLYASSSRKIQRLIEEQLSFYSHRGAGGDMRPRSWTPSDDKDMSSRRSMSAAVGGAGARRICKFYGVREYQGHPACGVDFLSGRLRDYGWESNKSLLSHGLSERDKRGPRLRHSVPCDPYDPYRVIHTVQDKLVLKLAAARTLRNHHTVAGWSLPLSVYPPSLSLSLSLSLALCNRGKQHRSWRDTAYDFCCTLRERGYLFSHHGTKFNSRTYRCEICDKTEDIFNVSEHFGTTKHKARVTQRNLTIPPEPTGAELAAWDAVFRSASATIRRLSEDPGFSGAAAATMREFKKLPDVAHSVTSSSTAHRAPQPLWVSL